MKRRSPVMTVAWVLVALLGLVVGFAALGQRDTTTNPDPSSYRPSGTAALAELLRRTGRTVSIDPSTRPKLSKSDVVIAFLDEETTGSGLEDAEALLSGGSPTERIWPRLQAFVEEGGSVLLLPFNPNFIKASRERIATLPTEVRRAGTEDRLHATIGPDAQPNWTKELFDNAVGPASLYTRREGPVVEAWGLGKGVVVEVVDGLIATNRFIDRQDNARLIISIVDMLSQDRSRVMISTATFGQIREPGLFGTIGDWAQVAWYQTLAALALVAVSLGVRFGLPEPSLSKQRGSRELLDAIADVFRRGGKAKEALTLASSSLERRVRKRLKLPARESSSLDSTDLPEPLAAKLRLATVASQERRLSPTDALRLLQEAEAAETESLI
jgi:hypothetical protein